jgi:hypothetical protein
MPALTCGTTGSAGGSFSSAIRSGSGPPLAATGVNCIPFINVRIGILEAIAQFNPYQEAILHFVSREIAWASCCRSQGLRIPTFGRSVDSVPLHHGRPQYVHCPCSADTFNSQLKSSPSTWCMGDNERTSVGDLDPTPPKICPRLLWPNDCLKED